MERNELLDPHNRPSKYDGVISNNIACNNSNNSFWAVENGVMGQDETTISINGTLIEISQRFPNHYHQTRPMFYLQLNSKETFMCYYIQSRADHMEYLVKRYGC